MTPDNLSAHSKVHSKDINNDLKSLQQKLLHEIATLQKIQPSNIEFDNDLTEYGFDSISFAELATVINQNYDTDLMPTVFFEYPNIISLSQHLLESYPVFSSLKGAASSDNSPIDNTSIGNITGKNIGRQENSISELTSTEALSLNRKRRGRRSYSKKDDKHINIESNPAESELIAIIGMSGRFPGSPTLETYWQNIKANKDCITRVPGDRWDWQAYYGDPIKEPGKTKVNSGGFISGVDEFDPLFFGISPREAELLDPQFRLFLETVWAATEDAGYPSTLISGSKTGVFVGASTMDYKELAKQAEAQSGIQGASGMFHFLLANRISYLLNLKGPSEAIDTACSSSLIAIIRAIESIRQGSCEMALAGGVNIIVSPSLTIGASQAGMLSIDGRCKTFDKGADGYGRGEGVGAVFLKPLSKAVQDNDHIYGLIRGAAENHGGKAASPTSPNPVAQGELIFNAYQNAGVNPTTVSYIEAHGTGTELGDPIEIKGLKNGFNALYKAQSLANVPNAYCALGSVKTNIGHLEAAAGISGVLKVLLMMKHQQIPGNPHLKTPNPYLDIENTPFYLAKETQHWKKITDTSLPRRAGISSFGVGGANAHILLEEYSHATKNYGIESDANKPSIIVLSAKNEAALKNVAENLYNFIKMQTGDNKLILDNLAFTLQVGRDAMENRMGFIAHSLVEVEETLQAYIQDIEDGEIYRGQSKQNKDVLSILDAGDIGKMVSDWLADDSFSKIINYWVKGGDINWNQLERATITARISLPTYPFARERHWISVNKESMDSRPAESSKKEVIHPLLHKNTSVFSEQKFTSYFSGEEFFLNDHVIAGHRVLPGMAYLEMARAAVVTSLEERPHSLIIRNVVWLRPLAISDISPSVQISLEPLDDEIVYNISSEAKNTTVTDEAEVLHSQGKIYLSDRQCSDHYDIDDLRLGCNKAQFDGRDCYKLFKQVGVEYGKTFQLIDKLFVGDGRVLAKLHLPDSFSNTVNEFGLHPSILDASLHAWVGLLMAGSAEEVKSKMGLPFSLDELEIFDSCSKDMWSLVRRSDGCQAGDKVQKFDADLCDKNGNVCVRLRGASLMPLRTENAIVDDSKKAEPLAGLLALKPVWDRVRLPISRNELNQHDKGLVIFGGTSGQRSFMKKMYPSCELFNIGVNDSVDNIKTLLSSVNPINRILLFTPDATAIPFPDELIENQKCGVIPAFRLIKAILSLGYDKQALRWTVVTKQTRQVLQGEKIHPAHAGIHGLFGSLAKEHTHWNIQVADHSDEGNIFIEELLSIPKGEWGRTDNWGYRNGEWYRAALIPNRLETMSLQGSQLKQNGVYVLIGGAGRIGRAFSEYLIRVYQARVIWLGRRPMNDAIKQEIDNLKNLGPEPEYISADAGDLNSLTNAYRTIKKTHKVINGVVHSTLFFSDTPLMNMDEPEFASGLAPKVNVSVRMAQVFENEPLDFILFFSSLIAHIQNTRQSHYAAGCAFTDAFAQRLAFEFPCPVKIINWGFWISEGILNSEEFNEGLGDVGIGLITPEDGMKAIESILSNDISHIGVTKTTKQIALEGMKLDEEIQLYSSPLCDVSAALKKRIESDIKSNPSRMITNIISGYIESQKKKCMSTKYNILEIDREHIYDTHLPKEDTSYKEYINNYDQMGETFKERNLPVDHYHLILISHRVLSSENMNEELRSIKAALHKNGLFIVVQRQWDNTDHIDTNNLHQQLLQEGYKFEVLSLFDEGKGDVNIILAVSDGIVRQTIDVKEINKKNNINAHENEKSARENIEDKKGVTGDEPVMELESETSDSGDLSEALHKEAIEFIKNIVSEGLKIQADKIDEDEPLDQYGLDSIMAVKLTDALREVFSDITNTIFFEYQSISGLVEHLLDTQSDVFRSTLNISEVAGSVDEKLNGGNQQEKTSPSKSKINLPVGTKSTFSKKRKGVKKELEAQSNSNFNREIRDIAVIGMAGRYPKSDNLQLFWENLKDGVDCVTEIPGDRWNSELYFDEDKSKLGKSCCKWGGFIDGVTEFDALFFNISPVEAAILDPNERLYLQTAWHLLESSGYTRQTLKDRYNSQVGVYVGAMYQQYNLLNESGPNSIPFLPFYSSIANRVSFYFDFQGPSIAIDTGCSSSLMAIHMACESLIKDECRVAIAGGVNLSIHPQKYQALSLGQLLGSHINSRSFADGDGYLPAEGVGAVLLKPLSDAIESRDNILAVIKSTTTNHGGRTNGFSVPNINVQAKLYEDNLAKAGIDARTISYVESAANGSSLGDSIEIAALNKAFKKASKDEHYCAIGSVKSNIGHGEAASGISQLTKVILQMQHGEFVPTIKTDTMNPNLDFSKGPFYIQNEAAPWNRPSLNIDGEVKEYPRRASVSSFGGGGSNTNLIIEEYSPDYSLLNSDLVAPQLLILSAKNHERLLNMVNNLALYVQEIIDSTKTDKLTPTLSSVAYTLQCGREAMDYRLAVVVGDFNELLEELINYSTSVKDGCDKRSGNLFTGDLNDDSNVKSFVSGAFGERLVNLIIEDNRLIDLALYWTQGGKVPWDRIWVDENVQRVNLPVYPFEKRRCWIAPINKDENTIENVPTEKEPLILADNKSFSVIEIISSLLGLDEKEIQSNRALQEYGIDSILFVELARRLQTNMDPSIDVVTLQECTTIQDVVDVVSLKCEEKQSLEFDTEVFKPQHWPQFPELIPLRQGTNGRPVFWFHGGLGGVEVYNGIAAKSERPFYGIQARGWMTDQTPLKGIETIASYYRQIIQTVQPEGPYDLGGYSFGGLLAYEVTRQLQVLGQSVETIVMVDSLDSVSSKEDESLKEKHTILKAINFSLLETIKSAPEKLNGTLIHQDDLDLSLTDDEFLAKLVFEANKKGLSQTKDQFKKSIDKSAKIQQAFNSNGYNVTPLLDPKSVTCYYFRNKNGLLLGEFEPYFSLSKDMPSIDKTKYWDEWKTNLPNFHVMDIDVSSHMVIFSEPKIYQSIEEFCNILYSLEGIDAKKITSFKRKVKRIHGVMKEVRKNKKTTHSN